MGRPVCHILEVHYLHQWLVYVHNNGVIFRFEHQRTFYYRSKILWWWKMWFNDKELINNDMMNNFQPNRCQKNTRVFEFGYWKYITYALKLATVFFPKPLYVAATSTTFDIMVSTNANVKAQCNSLFTGNNIIYLNNNHLQWPLGVFRLAIHRFNSHIYQHGECTLWTLYFSVPYTYVPFINFN